MLTRKGGMWLVMMVWSLLIWGLLFLIVRGCIWNKPQMVLESPHNRLESTSMVKTGIDLDKWADAIRKAENNPNYGIVSIPCSDEAQCRQYCKNTVYNTLVKYRTTRCKPEEGDLDCLSRRYCPIGSDTDDGTCIHWKSNVRFFLLSSL